MSTGISFQRLCAKFVSIRHSTKTNSKNRLRNTVVCRSSKSNSSSESQDVSDDNTNNFSTFIHKVRSNNVSDVFIKVGDKDQLLYKETGEKSFTKTNVFMSDILIEDMIEHDVQIHLQDKSFMSSSIFTVIIATFAYSMWFKFMAGNMMKFQSNGTSSEYQEADIVDGVKLSDVAGVDEVVEEVAEFIDFLKDPSKFHAAGAKIPTGCLLHGRPGTGKTMIAKAVANEAGVPFISCSASEFVELFVGMGASRVRKLFKKARDIAPCIIFIDEIDAIGKTRSGGLANGNDEREQTLNQILTEMDGFKDSVEIVVFAATNRLDSLDDALLRPGRFDRKIYVPLPDRDSRLMILNRYTEKLNTKDVSLEIIASKTIGMSGAELKNLVNEAAILSVRSNEKEISMKHFNNAISKVSIGIPKISKRAKKDSYRVAVHETGHALIAMLQSDFDAVDQISILSVGEAAGVTTFIPVESSGLYTYDYYVKKIMVALGGHAAEEIMFSKKNVSSGAISDFKQVSSIAYFMIKELGYSTFVGKLSLSDVNVSDHTQTLIDNEVKLLIDTCYAEVLLTIEKNHNFVDIASQRLLDEKTLSGNQFHIMYKNHLSEVE